MSHPRFRRSLVAVSAMLACVSFFPVDSRAEESPEELRRTTAVALNYCRASFQRIQRTPSKRVLIEEQEKILNNLNLTGVADPEVVALYAAVLQEIGDVQILDREREVIRQTHRRAIVRDLVLNSWALGTQVASQHYLGALQTGAKSWWDYRSAVFVRELDMWRIERERFQSVINKSTLFLDTFWKLARKRDIPDRWLIRHRDLDELDDAVRETRPDVRLRVLQRMERFMEAYPPYWYYMARTLQELGRFSEAADTYRRLIGFGDGHFRRDEMLAASLANLALLEEYAKLPTAVETATRALDQDTDVWEVNLQCGLLLARHREFRHAEDAILRNLDVDLESTQSRIGLVGIHLETRDSKKLSAMLSRPGVAATVPAPMLLASVAALGTGQIPPAVTAQLTRSLTVGFDRRIGKDDVVVKASPSWQMARARIGLQLGNAVQEHPEVTATDDGHEIRFPRADRAAGPLALVLQYPEGDVLRLRFEELSADAVAGVLGEQERGILAPLWDSKSWRITAADVFGGRVFLPTADATTRLPMPVIELPPAVPVSNVGRAGHTLPVVRPH